MVRYFLTGALDHNQRLFKANLSPTPICPHCEQAEETAHHIFWECCSWHSVRTHYPTLMKLYSLCGAFWPNTLLHCGWILPDHPYGFHLLHSLNIQYDLPNFANDLHQMYLNILIQPYHTNQVLRQVPVTPVQQHFSSYISVSSNSDNDSPIYVDTPWAFFHISTTVDSMIIPILCTVQNG